MAQFSTLIPIQEMDWITRNWKKHAIFDHQNRSRCRFLHTNVNPWKGNARSVIDTYNSSAFFPSTVPTPSITPRDAFAFSIFQNNPSKPREELRLILPNKKSSKPSNARKVLHRKYPGIFHLSTQNDSGCPEPTNYNLNKPSAEVDTKRTRKWEITDFELSKVSTSLTDPVADKWNKNQPSVAEHKHMPMN